MQTTKKTIITLDAGDEIEVRFQRDDKSWIEVGLLAIANTPTTDEDDGSCSQMRLVTREVTYLNGETARGLRPSPQSYTDMDDLLVSDGEVLTITLV